MEEPLRPEQMPEVQKLFQVSQNYVDSIKNMQSLLEPKRLDRFAESMGWESRAHKNILNRLRESDIGSLRANFHDVCSQGISLTRGIYRDAERLRETSTASILLINKEIEVLENHIDLIFDKYKDSIEFIQKSSMQNWEKKEVKWSHLDIMKVDELIKKSDEDNPGRINFSARETQSNIPELVMVFSQ